MADFICGVFDMAISICKELTAELLKPKAERLFELSAQKIRSLQKTWDLAKGAPVFTAKGQYTARGWTEWTQGFQFGSALLQFDATGETEFLDYGRQSTLRYMATHVSHVGVHDHGFNNVSTYGNLWRLMNEGKIPEAPDPRATYDLALKVSGAIQAARWTRIHNGEGFIYSFNGPHSLFIDTMRSLRSLAVAHQLGHVLMGERDARISLLERLVQHARTTAEYSIYHGTGRDFYDTVPGRTAHESIFNTNDGSYRCPNSQQGYSPFSTWTRGLAWAILGFAEQLEFLQTLRAEEFEKLGGKEAVTGILSRAAEATASFYIQNAGACGIPIWDTGAPNLGRVEQDEGAMDPYNEREPVDSSAASIAAQGLLRLGNFLIRGGSSDVETKEELFRKAAFTIANTIFSEPYISVDTNHQGLILHSVYHRPNGWDYVHPGQKIPNGESSMWGDYHARELALMILREAQKGKYYTFWRPRD
jgi:unsaturated chondroitin disaccharide hydrolase